MAERATLQVAIQSRFKLKKSIAAKILLDILEEERKSEKRRSKTRDWIRKREEKGYYNNIVQGTDDQRDSRLPRNDANDS